MSYVLVKDGCTFTLTDLDAINGGVPSRVMPVKYRTKEGTKSGIFIDYGKKQEMEQLRKNAMVLLGKKQRGRKRKEVTKGFSVHPPNGGLHYTNENDEMGNGEEEEQSTPKRNTRHRKRSPTPILDSSIDNTPVVSPSRPTTATKRKTTKTRNGKRAPTPILDPSFHNTPAVSPSRPTAATVHQSGMDADLLRAILDERLGPIESSITQLKRAMGRMEDASTEDTNVKLIDTRDNGLTNKIEKLSNCLDRIVASLPANPSRFDYTYIPKSYVDLHNTMGVHLLELATTMEKYMFPDERHLTIQERDPVKVKWLYDLLCRRRNISVGIERTRQLKYVRRRVNKNVWNPNNKKKKAVAHPPLNPRGQKGTFESPSFSQSSQSSRSIIRPYNDFVPSSSYRPFHTRVSNREVFYEQEEDVLPSSSCRPFPARLSNREVLYEEDQEEDIMMPESQSNGSYTPVYTRYEPKYDHTNLNYDSDF